MALDPAEQEAAGLAPPTSISDVDQHPLPDFAGMSLAALRPMFDALPEADVHRLIAALLSEDSHPYWVHVDVARRDH